MTRDAKQDPTPEPRSRRSDTTRASILTAALERFAADGYERATIRAIAKDARIDPSMVMRYYGNKEQLFEAACTVDLRLPDLLTVPEAEVGRTLVGHFVDLWEQSGALTALLRVGVTNQAGAERMQEIFKQQLLPLAARICPAPTTAPVRAALVASQMLGMALTRYVLRFPVTAAMTRDEITDWLAPTVQRYLTAENPAAGAPAPVPPAPEPPSTR
ncbi:TetR family transcriptional regulator [Streptomyces sp. BE147]|uniref:TetR/AcrR family transcriptional regulator n=1 Tax=Streptomyces sp. BE147 TaxID=3002524 RepID=UPI002E76D2E5|nr:TetR family transcriptional regulator [Streptomyces sp. BE147]MEE1739527.1 TetR family transcriptional regulator [Streptomyces sp. BE147]